MNHCDTVLKSIFRSGKAHFPAFKEDIALILLIGTEKTLHHCGLTSTVLTHKPHDRSALHIQVDMVQHSVSAKGLAHTAYG